MDPIHPLTQSCDACLRARYRRVVGLALVRSVVVGGVVWGMVRVAAVLPPDTAAGWVLMSCALMGARAVEGVRLRG